MTVNVTATVTADPDAAAAVAARIRLARARAGLSQTALAARLGCTRPTVGRWERGTRRPSLAALLRLAAALGVAAAELLPEPASASEAGSASDKPRSTASRPAGQNPLLSSGTRASGTRVGGKGAPKEG